MITKTTREHRADILSIVESSGQFDADGLAHVQDTLDAHLDQTSQSTWLTAMDSAPVGVAYCAPEPVTSGTWNLLMLWVKAGYEGRGFDRALVDRVEQELAAGGARLLIVETSQLPEFEVARAFYQRTGFKLEAEIADFFADGDNKLIYTKALSYTPS